MRGRQKKRKHEGALRLRKGDKVAVIAGADRGKGPVEIVRVDRDHGRVTVQGVNVRTKHERKSQKNPQGGVKKVESPIPVGRVLLWSDKLKRGVRIRMEVRDGEKVRVGVPCGTVFS